MKKVFVPKTPEEKQMQRALLQYFKPENKDIVKKALLKAGRQDLIGNGPNCLIQGNANLNGKNFSNNRKPPRKMGGKWQPKKRR